MHKDEMKEYRICTECEIHHYENCGTCLGFGVFNPTPYPDNYTCVYPIPAGLAYDYVTDGIPFEEKWNACPECGSTPWGIPQTEENTHAQGWMDTDFEK